MIAFDSQSTKSPSRITGTNPLGFSERNSGVCVDLNPEPQSSRSKGRFNSAQVHSTLRTFMEGALPRILSMARLNGVGCQESGGRRVSTSMYSLSAKRHFSLGLASNRVVREPSIRMFRDESYALLLSADPRASLSIHFANACSGPPSNSIGSGRTRQKFLVIALPSGHSATKRPSSSSASM